MLISGESENLNTDPNFSCLRGRDEYARYFNQLSLAFAMLSKSYAEQASSQQEAAEIALFLESFLATINALRLKYTYGPELRRPLWVDLTESGFPNAADIVLLSLDLARKEEVLRELPPSSVIGQTILDHLFQHRQDPLALLAKQSTRSYLEYITENSLFYAFTPGRLRRSAVGGGDSRAERESNVRSYTYSWGCYDSASNRPYLHLLLFEQDLEEVPLEDDQVGFAQFCRVIETLGGRAPDIAVLAIGIDQALETIHPKIIKRVCIGPLYSRLLLTDREANKDDKKELAIASMFARSEVSDEHDFLLFFSDEITFSKRQEIKPTLLSSSGKIREIFAVEENDPECSSRRAAVVRHQVLMQHSLLQQISTEKQEAIDFLQRCRKTTFDRNGTIYGI